MARAIPLLCLLSLAAAEHAGADGFCCLAGEDAHNICGTCLRNARTPPEHFCSRWNTCGVCAEHAKWCSPIIDVEPVKTTTNTTTSTTTPMTRTPLVDAVAQHGRLRAKGNKIVDEHGMPVRLRGMSMFWSQWMPQFWNADVVHWLKKDWHVTLVRAAMAVGHGGYLKHPAAEKARLEAVVEACIDAGIYVVIDWHDYHADLHISEAKAFFSEMAEKYGRYPNVLFETFNEPQQVDWATVIKPYHEEIVPVIRRHTDNLIILGTRMWSQEVEEASLDPVRGENLAYTIHFYAASMGAPLRAKVSAALSNGVPIFATEWGTCEYTGNGAVNLAETQAWLDFFEEHHISDANWGVSDKAESCSALQEGASRKGGWHVDQLSMSGVFVRKSLRAYNHVHPRPTRSEGHTSSASAASSAPHRVDDEEAPRSSWLPRSSGSQSSSRCAGAWQQCGGKAYSGPTCCQTGCACKATGHYYSQCRPSVGTMCGKEEPVFLDVDSSMTMRKDAFLRGRIAGAAGELRGRPAAVAALAAAAALAVASALAVAVRRYHPTRAAAGAVSAAASVEEELLVA